jgi:glycosidase
VTRRLGATAAAALSLCLALPALARDPFDSPISDEVFYHIMPIAWRDSDNDSSRFGDFQGMTDSLDYLEGLGVTAVWMNPIFPSAAYHGYQHGPADQLDPRFGTQAQFFAFVSAAKARGIKVYLDFVVYGISHNSTWYQSAHNNPASPYDTWLAFTNGSNSQYLGSVYNTWNGASVGFIHWDLRNAQAADLVTSWALKWLDPDNNPATDDGIAGYRFDHCWVNYPSGPSGWGYNLTSFWRPFFNELRALKPDVFNFGEQADWGSFGGEFLSDFDAMFTKPFEFAARDALLSGNAQPLYDRMNTTISSAVAAGQGTFLTIIGDHDVDRLSSVINAGSPLLPSRAHAAAALHMLQPFPPIIYYGDEIGMRGVKANYGSDANDIPMREPMKWNAVAGPPMSNYQVLNAQAHNNRYSQNNDSRSVEEQVGISGSLLETYRSLIALRRAQPALRRGDYRPVSTNRSYFWAFARHYEPELGSPETLLVLINLGAPGQSFTATADFSAFELLGASAPVTDAATGAAQTAITPANLSAYSVTVPAYGYRVLRVEGVQPVPPPPARVTGVDLPTRFNALDLIATQDTPTTFGNNSNELNQMWVSREADGLRIGLTGNLNTDGTALVILIDGEAGGQTQLDLLNQSPPPSGLVELTDTLFDFGFEPETMFFVNAFGSSIYVDQLALGVGTSVKTYRGRGTVNIGNGALDGGTNNGGVQFALDNHNTAGVTSSSAANAATATTGAELFVSYAYLGLDTPHCGELRVAAFISGTNGLVSSQILPGAGGVAQNLGFFPFFPSVPGTQHAAVTRVPATCAPPPCLGNANGDSIVDFNDINAVLANWLTPGPDGDANGDGAVNFDDITSALSNWLNACP